MASDLKFVYYSKQNCSKNMTRYNGQNSEIKQQFRRSGSLKASLSLDEKFAHLQELSVGSNESSDNFRSLVTLIVKVQRTTEKITGILCCIPNFGVLKHIESRECQIDETFLEILLEIESTNPNIREATVENLHQNNFQVTEVGTTRIPIVESDAVDEPGFENMTVGSVWFPRHISELDICTRNVIMYDDGSLDANHPSFKDPEYRKRRLMFSELAYNYKQGTPIPKVKYNENELKTWKVVYLKLEELHKKLACKEYLNNFELLKKHCNYSANCIPQLEDVSRFLKARSGFTLRPVAGYLSPRDFLACLAFRVFCCTQYIRHHAEPSYTPEPDTVHELLGHAPLLADPIFAQLTQEIGIASLGASDKDLKMLANAYFFTIEFGLLEQTPEINSLEDQPKCMVYGAGLLSSAAELQHATSDAAKVDAINFDAIARQQCMVTTYQTSYYSARNFCEVVEKLSAFNINMKRPFVARYNPYTLTIDVLNNKRTLLNSINAIRSDTNLLTAALNNVL